MNQYEAIAIAQELANRSGKPVVVTHLGGSTGSVVGKGRPGQSFTQVWPELKK